jgi:uncharacterized protein YbjT (DUF2867 family)
MSTAVPRPMAGYTVLVTGVRGKTGREVAAQLARRHGVTVRGGSSSPDRIGPAGVSPVGFDWAQPDSWADAVDDVDAIYMMRPDIEDAPARVAQLAAAAPPAARLVLLSEMGAEHLAPAAWVSAVERAVITGGRPWTILRPSWFQQVLTDQRFYRDDIVDRGVLAIPSGGAALSWVDARDIAAVAVEALTAPTHDGATYTISGPAALGVAEVAELLSAALPRPVRALDPRPADVVAGFSPWLAEVVGDVYERTRAGAFGEVTDDVSRVTGRPARSIAAFIAEHAAAWRPARHDEFRSPRESKTYGPSS